jgi:hypothetical protein
MWVVGQNRRCRCGHCRQSDCCCAIIVSSLTCLIRWRRQKEKDTLPRAHPFTRRTDSSTRSRYSTSKQLHKLHSIRNCTVHDNETNFASEGVSISCGCSTTENHFIQFPHSCYKTRSFFFFFFNLSMISNDD